MKIPEDKKMKVPEDQEYEGTWRSRNKGTWRSRIWRYLKIKNMKVPEDQVLLLQWAGIRREWWQEWEDRRIGITNAVSETVHLNKNTFIKYNNYLYQTQIFSSLIFAQL